MEKETSATEASASTGVTNQDDVAAMLEKLGPKEDNLDDVVFEEEEKHPDEDARWMAVARVHTESEFSHYCFFKNMRYAWDLAKEVKIRVIEDNLFIMKFSCLGDWEKVMDGGPWVFRGKSVLIAPYDGFPKPSTIELNTVLTWIQIHDLPDGFKGMVKSLASKVGEYVVMEPPSTEYVGNFYRVRVRIDVRKQLKCLVSIILAGKREVFLGKYERIPDWCVVCGMLGHLYKEHGDGVHDLAAQVFKDLKASYAWRPSSRPSRGRGRGVGSMSGPARGGRGRGGKLLNDESYDGDNGKDEDMNDANHNRKRGAARGPLHQIADHAKDILNMS
ncbi:hypothetical protein ACQ4PT_045229 [Festuca glaucescens]